MTDAPAVAHGSEVTGHVLRGHHGRMIASGHRGRPVTRSEVTTPALEQYESRHDREACDSMSCGAAAESHRLII